MLRLGESVRDDAAEIDALNCLHMHPLHPLTPHHHSLHRPGHSIQSSVQGPTVDHLACICSILESPGFHTLFGQEKQFTFSK